VLYRGKVIGELPAGASRDEVGLMMAGVPAAQAHTEAATNPTALAAADQEVAE
jgi:simple sugar transport system ATP-binding protein